MNDKKRIQEEVEKTLESLDGIQRAAANPYLFTRIKARVEKEENKLLEQGINFYIPAISGRSGDRINYFD